MKLQVQIQVINPARHGISAATGKEWKSQDVVIAWPEMLDDGHIAYNYQLCTLRGEQVDRFAQRNPQTGMVLDVDIEFSTRMYNNRVYNDNTLILL